MYLGTAECFGIDHFARGGFYQRRTTKKDRALLLDDDGFIAHCRHIGTARSAGTHDHGDLGNTQRAHLRLVVEDAPEMFAVGEYLVLQRQERAAGIHQVHAGQAVFQGDLLCTQMLFHEIGAAFHGGVVGDHQHFLALDPANSGDESRARRSVLIHAVGCQRGNFEEGRSGIEQGANAFAWQQLAALGVPCARLVASAE